MPNRPSPAPKSEEVLASLAAMANEIDPNGFELKRLEREARKLLNVDAVSGYTALGAIASLRGDVEDVDTQIRDCPHLMDDPGLKFMPAFIGASVDGSQPQTIT